MERGAKQRSVNDLQKEIFIGLVFKLASLRNDRYVTTIFPAEYFGTFMFSQGYNLEGERGLKPPFTHTTFLNPKYKKSLNNKVEHRKTMQYHNLIGMRKLFQVSKTVNVYR